MTSIILLNKARKLGEAAADQYIDEFGVAPNHDGPEKVGDWDSAVWQDDWQTLKAEGAEDYDYEDCLKDWRYGYWKGGI